jgi:hypothetical protein
VWGWLVMIVPPFLAAFVAYDLRTDCVVLDRDGFTLTTGFPWSQREHRVDFTQVDQVELHERRSHTARGLRVWTWLSFRRIDGSWQEVPVGDLMEHGPQQAILAILQERGIQFADKRPPPE